MRTAIIVLSTLVTLVSVRAQPSPFAWKSIQFPDGQRLEFRAHLPPDFDRAKPHPVAMVFVDGAQDRAAVWDTLTGYWFRQAAEHGWVVVLPVAPKAGRFHEGGESLLPALIRNLRVGLTIEGNRLHAVGVGEGAKSAFHVVASAPFEFASLTAFGDGSLGGDDLRRLARLAEVEVYLFSPAEDEKPRSPMPGLLEKLREKRVHTQWSAMAEYDNTAIWKTLLAERQRLCPPVSTEAEVAAALDAWHDAAAKGDGERYFGAFAPEGVFMGTDATERWTLEAFRTWAAPYFKRPSAWIFVPVSRNVLLSPDGDVAWFDEVLGSAHYGDCRGTGVARMIDDTWKIAHYNLSVPVPNDLLGDVVAEIRTLQDALERGATASEATTPVTFYLVAPAESGDMALTPTGHEQAAALAKLLGSTGLSTVIAFDSQRVRETVAPAARVAGVEIETFEDLTVPQLAVRLRSLSPGASALVAVPLKTLTDLLQALRAGDPKRAANPSPGDLLVVTLDAAGRAHLETLRHAE